MRIGILGGSFDPIHNGHMHMAKCACQYKGLDEVWLVPTGHSPHKDEQKMTSPRDRYAMCELAASTDARIKVSTVELDSTGKNYTYITLEKLTTQYPMHEFFFIMGGDSLDYFEQWVHPERICELAKLLVIPRDRYHHSYLEKKAGEIKQLFPCHIEIISCENYPLSSTEIRARLKQNIAKEEDFPEGVLNYIRTHALYQ